MKLIDLLNSKKCFKLVCAAANENEEEVEKLVAIYAKAGCHFFDLCAKKEILEAAKKGLNRVVKKEDSQDYFFCISVAMKDDIHISKAQIDRKKCTLCGACSKVCEQKAVQKDFSIFEPFCIGCHKCFEACKNNAVSFYSKERDFSSVLTDIEKSEIDCIELHISSEDEDEIDKKWQELNNSFEGILSICLNRTQLGDEKIIQRLKKMLTLRKPFSTIIQTDGRPMSGSCDDFKTTLQTVAFAEIIQNALMPAFIMLSGGTNSKTSELAKLCNISAHGIAVGSYARKIVRPYIEMPDFFNNEKAFNPAVEEARKLIEKSIQLG